MYMSVHMFILILFPSQNAIDSSISEVIPCVFIATKTDLPTVEQVNGEREREEKERGDSGGERGRGIDGEGRRDIGSVCVSAFFNICIHGVCVGA